MLTKLVENNQKNVKKKLGENQKKSIKIGKKMKFEKYDIQLIFDQSRKKKEDIREKSTFKALACAS